MTQEGEKETTSPGEAAQVNLTSKELAPSVFAVMADDVPEKERVAITTGFVIGKLSVLVIASMQNGDLASQLIGLVRQATTKPVGRSRARGGRHAPIRRVQLV
jgi:cyclase